MNEQNQVNKYTTFCLDTKITFLQKGKKTLPVDPVEGETNLCVLDSTGQYQSSSQRKRWDWKDGSVDKVLAEQTRT